MVPRRAVMSPEAVTEFLKLLQNFHPAWVCAIVTFAILATKSPQLMKEFFAGLHKLRNGQPPKK
jgi:hypothetical protein